MMPSFAVVSALLLPLLRWSSLEHSKTPNSRCLTPNKSPRCSTQQPHPPPSRDPSPRSSVRSAPHCYAALPGLTPPTNPLPATPPHYQYSHSTGERTLWVVFGLMALSAGVFAVMSWNVPTSKRVYHVTTTLFTIVSALTYFAMATGQSSSLACHAVRDHHSHVPDTFHDECRQVFWGRYVDWALTSPLVLLNLCLLAGVDGAHTLMAIVADVVMVLGGVFAAYGDESTAQVWGWFIISCLGYLFVVWHVGVHGAKMVQSKGVRVSRLWSTLTVYSLTLWLAYPM